MDNHQARFCKSTPCSYCGLRVCFGARKRGPQVGCLVKKIVEGGAVGPKDVGLNGKPLNEALVARVKERAAEIKDKKTNEANTATQTVVDDDLYADGDSD